MMPFFLGLSGCLVDWDTYNERKDFLTDGDGDGFSEYDGDCDDSNTAIFPGADELCNGLDDDCDGEADVGAIDAGGWFPDEDADGYGDIEKENTLCEVPSGFVSQGGDCDDDREDIFPGAPESCNSLDDDCDGVVDEDALDQSAWFVDSDGDGYGQRDSILFSCIQPDGTSPSGEDCDDANPNASPEATEVCGDGIDNDCDGDIGACGWDVEIDLKDQILITGVEYQDTLGQGGTVADLNGDGSLELIIGAYYAQEGSPSNRTGSIHSFERPITKMLQTAGEADRIWRGATPGGLAYDVEHADLNGDGFDDLLTGEIGRKNANGEYIGRGYILYGPVTTGFDLSTATADWSIDGDIGDEMSKHIHALGDIDGDSIDDFAMGGAFSDTGGLGNSGITYIYTNAGSGYEFATDSMFASIHGYDPDDALGYSMVGADVDGDGRNEVVVAAPAAHYGDGEVYLFEHGSLALSCIGPDGDELWTGEDSGGAGTSMDKGDLDGDGIEDLLIGGDSAQDGSAYIVFGQEGIRGAFLGDALVRFRGVETTGFGWRLRIGDLNNDDINDVVIGEGQNVPDDLFVFFGPFDESATLYSSDANVKLGGDGVADEEYEVLAIDDLTGDGLNDIVIGSPYGYADYGLTYIVPGTGW